MPTIEVLPSTSASSGPNWTYSNLPPALAHRNSLPTASSRVRATRTTNSENSAARQRQINSRIVELERDNYRDVAIPVPARKKDRSSRTKSSSTPNVRRVLASQKTFANHLADAEATGRRDGEGEVEEEGGGRSGYAECAAAPGTAPGRTFCEICGYWGRYRCQRCAARYCGMDCGAVHAETRCNKFYA